MVGWPKASSGLVRPLTCLQSLITVVLVSNGSGPLTSLVLRRFSSSVVALEPGFCYQEWISIEGRLWSYPGHSCWGITLTVWPWAGHSASWVSGFSSTAQHSPWSIQLLINTGSHIYQIWKVQIPQIGCLRAWLYLSLIVKAWLILITSKSMIASWPYPRKEEIISSVLKYF